MDKNIFIYGDTNSKKEYLLKAFIEIYSNKKDINLFLVDPKKIEFEEYKNYCYFGYIINNFKDFETKFTDFQKLKGKKLIILNEIADFVYNEEHYDAFKEIMLNIMQSIKDIQFIVCTQRQLDKKLNFLISDKNIVKFIF
ncbi:MAG: hypothetical protein WC850_04595 [Candidatus Gracilibacteria bacterium]